jgi:hypothetical protein
LDLQPSNLGSDTNVRIRTFLGVDQWVVVAPFDKVHIDPTMNGRTREKREKMRERGDDTVLS